MKILQFINRKQLRGAEVFASQLSNHLVERGEEVKMIALFEGDSLLPFRGEIDSLSADSRKRFYDIKTWGKINRIIKDYKPDIIQANSGETLKYLVFSKILFGWNTPLVFRNASEVGRYIKSYPQKLFNRFLYKKVDHIISVSSQSKQDFLRLFPDFNNKISYIPIGVETEININEGSFFSKKKKHIIHVGGFTFEKNHFELIDIFNDLKKYDSNIHLHLVGDGALKRRIEEKVEVLNLTDNVTFYGFMNKPMELIKSADVLVLPSLIEGLPGVILEAMLVKTPVVAYNVGGIKEILNSETGFLIESGKKQEFIDAIHKVLQKKPVDKIEKAYQLVINKFSNEKIAQEFIQVYTKTLNEKN